MLAWNNVRSRCSSIAYARVIVFQMLHAVTAMF